MGSLCLVLPVSFLLSISLSLSLSLSLSVSLSLSIPLRESIPRQPSVNQSESEGGKRKRKRPTSTTIGNIGTAIGTIRNFEAGKAYLGSHPQPKAKANWAAIG